MNKKKKWKSCEKIRTELKKIKNYLNKMFLCFNSTSNVQISEKSVEKIGNNNPLYIEYQQIEAWRNKVLMWKNETRSVIIVECWTDN